MAYAFWIGDVQLPIPPAKLETTISNKNKTITMINEGEVNILKSPGLTDIKFTCMLPHMKYPFAATDFEPMGNYLDYFQELKAGKEPFQFIVSRCTPGGQLLFDSNITVTLEDYSVTEDAKNGLDIDVDINLREWRYYGTKTVTIERPSETAPVIKVETRKKKKKKKKKKTSSKSTSKARKPASSGSSFKNTSSGSSSRKTTTRSGKDQQAASIKATPRKELIKKKVAETVHKVATTFKDMVKKITTKTGKTQTTVPKRVTNTSATLRVVKR